jgi:hypothetical protein
MSDPKPVVRYDIPRQTRAVLCKAKDCQTWICFVPTSDGKQMPVEASGEARKGRADLHRVENQTPNWYVVADFPGDGIKRELVVWGKLFEKARIERIARRLDIFNIVRVAELYDLVELSDKANGLGCRNRGHAGIKFEIKLDRRPIAKDHGFEVLLLRVLVKVPDEGSDETQSIFLRVAALPWATKIEIPGRAKCPFEDEQDIGLVRDSAEPIKIIFLTALVHEGSEGQMDR